jgi:hypothetical protein
LSWQPQTPLEFVASFVVMWVAMSLLLANLSGWRRLAEYHRAVAPFVGRTWRFESASFRRFVHYGNILTFGANSEGLYIAVLFPFRIAHPPLLIPWALVRRVSPSFFHLFSTPFELGAEPRVRIAIKKRLVAKFEEHLRNELVAAFACDVWQSGSGTIARDA